MAYTKQNYQPGDVLTAEQVNKIQDAIVTNEGNIEGHIVNKLNPHGVTTEQIGAAERQHTHSTSDISSGTLSSDRLPTVPISKGGTGATTASDALVKLGLTATATELNYTDGVTSNIQSQLNTKAESNHNHSASNITSGTLPIERGGTGATTAEAALTNLGAFSSAGGTLSGNIILPNGKGYQQKDTNGTAYSLIFLSTSNSLQIGYGLPSSYPIKINNPFVLTSDVYGQSLPTAGTAGRIFFKKVSS